MSYLLYGFLIILSLLVIGNIFTEILQDLFIFRPVKLKKDHVFRFKIPFEEITLDTPHNGKINVLWFHNPDQKRPLVFYSHGNSSNLDDWGDLCYYFDELGYDLIIYDFRGFGKSKGRRNEKSFLSDATAVYDFALRHYDKENIVLYGRSMGTGVSTMLATEKGAKLLILETPYYSIPSLFKSYYPFLPVALFSFKYSFPTNEWLKQVECPVYIFQGTRDTVVPYRCAVQLKPLMKQPENFITISGARHNNLSEYEMFTNDLKSILLHLK